ncbi:kinase-like domain-containing protein [Phascolomyces articulosus]|uniref:Kinase-like domain-containing protein n=1 Tax=Phascolomyces articulosus TaxID=60185 RepID=A0AAD5PFF2_9FUNG|nr:kinase-like domain-containing protein [Phascolomyces articulosus]
MSSAIYSFINSITNSITSRYDIKAQISTAGLWKIYLGLRKTTGKHVAIFIFEKRSLDVSFKRERGASKNDTEKVYELLKKEASNLARLRHPSILEVVEPVSESRSSIAFVTEPLLGTLSHLLKMESNYSSAGSDAAYEVDELEIQKGLSQVGKGMQFLNDAKVVHHNLTPESIFVNAKGDWKIGGLGFGVFLNNPAERDSSTYYDYNDYLPEACQINLDYAAPEFVLDNEVTQANDMFALGCLAYAIHNKGVPLLHTFNNLRTYERKIQGLNMMDYKKMPPHFQDVIRSLLARYPSQRITAEEFQSSKYFDNILVSTMKFLESFPEKTREEKSQFMKGLARVLNQFPDRVLKRKILPQLLEELKNHQLLPYTIPNVFAIVEQLNQREFCELVLPSLKPVFQVRDPPQNMIVLLEKLDTLQQKTPRETFRDDIMPLVYAALEAPTPLVQEKALRIVPSLAESLDYTTVKNAVFPRVQALFVQTTVLSVKVSTLICFHSMIKVIDKYTMQEKLVPLLKNIKTKEPAVMLSTLAVYDELGKHLDKEIIATEILPQLWRMSFGPLLNLEQFRKFMKTIRELTNRVEEAHTRHLQEVKSLEDQTRNVSTKSSPMNSNGQVGVGDEEVSFEALVQGRSTTTQSAATGDGSNTPDMFSDMVSAAPTASITPVTATSTTNNFMSSGWQTTNTNNNSGRQSPMMAPLSPSSGSSSPVRRPAANPMNFNTSTLSPMSSQAPQPTTPTTTIDWSSSMNSQKPVNSFNNNNSNTIPTLSAPTSSLFSSIPSLPPPQQQQQQSMPSSMATLSLTGNTNSSGGGSVNGNYSALRGLPTTMMPLAPSTTTHTSRPSSMELLQPNRLSNQSRTSMQGQTGHKLSNLTSFDPLG